MGATNMIITSKTRMCAIGAGESRMTAADHRRWLLNTPSGRTIAWAQGLAFAALTALSLSAAAAHAQTAAAGPATTAPSPDASASVIVDDVVVTARRRVERLQDVPDSVTAFTASKIQKTGIQTFADFAALTPNLTFIDNSSYTIGDSKISMRGIGNGQDGWPSVSYMIDGVPIDSLDALGDGTLNDIERIEVLRGPQSALYGFNAIAGAINVITARPTNDYTAKLQAIYASGNDASVLGVVSGPIVADKLLFRIQGYDRSMQGLIQSPTNGRYLDPDHEQHAKLELLFMPIPALEFDLRGEYGDVTP